MVRHEHGIYFVESWRPGVKEKETKDIHIKHPWCWTNNSLRYAEFLNFPKYCKLRDIDKSLVKSLEISNICNLPVTTMVFCGQYFRIVQWYFVNGIEDTLYLNIMFINDMESLTGNQSTYMFSRIQNLELTFLSGHPSCVLITFTAIKGKSL